MSKRHVARVVSLEQMENRMDVFSVQLVHLNTLPGYFHLHPSILAVVSKQGTSWSLIATSHAVRGCEHKVAHPAHNESMRTVLDRIGRRYAATFEATYEGYVGRSVSTMARKRDMPFAS